MPRFQSRLFNWIDRSAPVQLGRSVRTLIENLLHPRIGNPPISDSLQDAFRHGSPPKALPFQFGRQIGKQIARAVLYPVYLLGTVLKRKYPQLNPQANSQASRQLNPQENLQEQPQINFSPNAEAESPDDRASSSQSDLSENCQFNNPNFSVSAKTRSSNFLLHPFQKLVLWLFPDTLAISKPTAELKSGTETKQPILLPQTTPQISSKLRVPFLLLPFQKLGFGNATAKSQSTSELESQINAQTPNSLPNKKVPFLLLRSFQKIVLWMAPPTDLQVVRKLVDRFESPDFIEGEVIAEIKPPALPERKIPFLLRPFVKLVLWVDRTNLFKDNSQNSSSDANRQDTANKQLLEIWRERFQGINPQIDGDANLASNQALGKNEKLERMRDLIKAAIAYFFGKKVNPLKPDLSSENLPTSCEEAWLTMADLFGDEGDPWPLTGEFESLALTRASNISLTLQDDGLLATTPKSTDGNLVPTMDSSLPSSALTNSERVEIVLDDPNYLPDWSEYLAEPTPPLRAWIETHATFLGYAYSPIMEVVYWLDRLIARLERSLIWLWEKAISLPKWLFQKFVRLFKGNSKNENE
jgi:hypothetical protein